MIAAGLVPPGCWWAHPARWSQPRCAAPAATSQTVAVGTSGAAASVDPLATETAIEILRKGGNAVDAAVAAAGVLGVVEPFSCGIGGGGFMVIYRASDGLVTTIDSRETAPAAFTSTSFIAGATGQPLPFAEAVTSGLGVGVPGTLRGWRLALDRHGTMRLPRLLAPAKAIAENGFVVDQTFSTSSHRTLPVRGLHVHEAALPPGGAPPPVGSLFRNPELAATYGQIGGGPDAFYSGKLARAIVGLMPNPPVVPGSTRNVRPGIMTVGDLGAYRAIERGRPRTSDTAASTSTA